MTGSAIISACNQYRYTLTRRIPSVLRWVKPCLFIMLNPSTANGTQDDPTIRRCIGFAAGWGCTELTVVNLFALRATDPTELLKHEDPIGPLNEQYVLRALEDHKNIGEIVAAWGANGVAKRQLKLQHQIAAAGGKCLGKTANGTPKHPLYLPASQALEPWQAMMRNS